MSFEEKEESKPTKLDLGHKVIFACLSADTKSCQKRGIYKLLLIWDYFCLLYVVDLLFIIA